MCFCMYMTGSTTTRYDYTFLLHRLHVFLHDKQKHFTYTQLCDCEYREVESAEAQQKVSCTLTNYTQSRCKRQNNKLLFLVNVHLHMCIYTHTHTPDALHAAIRSTSCTIDLASIDNKDVAGAKVIHRSEKSYIYVERERVIS